MPVGPIALKGQQRAPAEVNRELFDRNWRHPNADVHEALFIVAMREAQRGARPLPKGEKPLIPRFGWWFDPECGFAHPIAKTVGAKLDPWTDELFYLSLDPFTGEKFPIFGRRGLRSPDRTPIGWRGSSYYYLSDQNAAPSWLARGGAMNSCLSNFDELNMVSDTSTIKAAQAAVTAFPGSRIFAVVEGAKTPIGKWKDIATRDRAHIEALFANSRNNLGLAIGGEIAVLDIEGPGKGLSKGSPGSEGLKAPIAKLGLFLTRSLRRPHQVGSIGTSRSSTDAYAS